MSWRQRQRGLTLIEMLMAMSVTAMIVVATAAMMQAVAYGTSSRRDMRGLVVKQKMLGGRLAAAVRESRMVLQYDTNYLVLWVHDTRENDVPNLSEVHLIEYHPNSDEVHSYEAVFDDGLTEEQLEAADTEYLLDTDFNTVLSALKNTDGFPSRMWATDVSGWAVTLNSDVQQNATLVSYRLTLDAGDLDDVTVGAAGLRNR